jgi:tetratricopeptide (TPR) repeat protein
MALAAPEADAMNARLLRASIIAVACALTGTPASRAQVPTSRLADIPTSRISRPPDLLMSEGHDLYAAGRYKDAAASFERALQLGVEKPHEAALGVARAYLQLGNRKQALRWGEIATQLASLGDVSEPDAARALPSSRHAPNGDALISRLEEVLWRTQQARTPTARSRSSASSMTSTT